MSEIELEIERMSFGPAAVGRYHQEGQTAPVVVFVTGAAPGERVRARLLKKHKNYWEAELLQVLRPSVDRVEPACPVYGQCGGCQWQHLSYPAQLQAKADILIHQLQRALRADPEKLRGKLTVHGAAHPYGYRTRLQVHGDAQGLGFFRPGTHEVAYTDRCPVAHEDIQRSWSTFLATQPLRELSRATGQFKVEWTRTETGQVLQAINRKHAAFGFSQINPEQNEVLVDVVTRLAANSKAGGDLLLDLYGGSGNLVRRLSDRFRHLVSVDTHNDGKAGSEVATPLQSGQVLVQEDVRSFLVDQRWRDWGFERVDCVIADPPRNGLRETARLISNLNASRVILVSCDPSTLARDLIAFSETAYLIESIDLVDMFPQTFHMEVVIGLGSSTQR